MHIVILYLIVEFYKYKCRGQKGCIRGDDFVNRAVKILTLAFRGEKKEAVFSELRSRLQDDTDVVMLPEMWLGDDFPVQTAESDLLKEIAALAAEHHCYIICPLTFFDGENRAERFNSALVFDRKGELIYRYDKAFPWWNEFDFVPPVKPGDKAGIFDTDFGRCGIAICFDVNFPCFWEEMARGGAEIVFWPSDYSAGRSLQAHAINYHYYIVTATREGDSALIDLNGDEIQYNKSDGITSTYYTVDLDREIFHENFNIEKIAALTAAEPGIKVEKRYLREQWIVLSGDKDTSVKALAKEYNIEPLRKYIFRSQREINGNVCRGPSSEQV